MGPRKDLAALAGVISPVVFGLGVVLTVAQYDFMTGLGWRPVGDSSGVPWPSGLALGPCGWLQVLNFVLFGVLLIFFALGLHRGWSGGRRSDPRSWRWPASRWCSRPSRRTRISPTALNLGTA